MLVWPDRGSNLRPTALETSTLTITPLMNLRSTALETSTLTITPLMNLRSTALKTSTLTITPLMRLEDVIIMISTLYNTNTYNSQIFMSLFFTVEDNLWSITYRSFFYIVVDNKAVRKMKQKSKIHLFVGKIKHTIVCWKMKHIIVLEKWNI